MARQSKDKGISWTDETVNPFAGCSWCSPACDRCWALAAAHLHHSGEGLTKKANGRIEWSGIVREYPEKLKLLAKMKSGRKVAIGLMGDIAYQGLRTEYFWQIWEAMAMAAQHSYQLLTKRPGRLIGLVPDKNPHWIGVTAENQPILEYRGQQLLQVGARYRYVSLEPLLGPIDFDGIGLLWPACIASEEEHEAEHDGGMWCDERSIDWVIVGGETGPGSRPMQVEWVLDILEKCQAARVPFHFKSWGDWIREDMAIDCLGFGKAYLATLPGSRTHRIGEHTYYKVGAKHSGRVLLGREWLELPEKKS